MCLTIHAVHFYDGRLVCSQGKVINGFIVRYLDVRGRALLKNSNEVAQELRAQFDSDRRQTVFYVFLFQGLLELVLRYS
jgi:hypothetical protein